MKAYHGDETHSLSSEFTKGKSSKHTRKIHQVARYVWINQVYKTRIHFICAFTTYMFSRKEGLTVPRAASLAISPTYSGNNRLLQIIDLSQGLFMQCQFLLMQLPITYFINVDFSNSMSMRESHRQYSLRYCNRSFIYKRYKDFVMFVLFLKINSLYSGNLGNSLGWQWTWTGQMETPAIFTLDTLTMGKKGQEAGRSQISILV